MIQKLNYNENPIDIPNPDRGVYRGRWQNIPPQLVTKENSPFGITPEVDHRVPIDATSLLFQGRQVPTVEGDDIELTEFYYGINQNDQAYIGGTGVNALPAVSYLGFDLANFSSNAFLSAAAAFSYQKDGFFVGPDSGEARTGKTGPLTAYALEYIRGLLLKVREGSSVCLLKFSYDGNGYNYIEPFKYPDQALQQGLILGPEPSYQTENNLNIMCNIAGHQDKNWMEYHIWQLTPIFQEFEDIIACVKIGMLGPWGEQHSSPLAQDPKTYKALFDAMLQAVPASRSLLTHAGGFLAWYNATYHTKYSFSNIDSMPLPQRGSQEARFGFFNDSYGAGDSDWSDNGSLSEGYEMFITTSDSSEYNRDRVVRWINKQNNFVQGEGGLEKNVYACLPGAIIEASALHTCLLNMRHGYYNTWNDFIYNKDNVTKPITFPLDSTEQQPPFTGQVKTAFYDAVYEGRSGLEYMRDRLGYRLVLREADIELLNIAEQKILRFSGKIQNVGFGNIINEKVLTAILQAKGSGKCFSITTDIDVRDWLVAQDGNNRADNTAAWRKFSFEIDLSQLVGREQGEYALYLKINDPKESSSNRRCLRFANYDLWQAELGANLVGTLFLPDK